MTSWKYEFNPDLLSGNIDLDKLKPGEERNRAIQAMRRQKCGRLAETPRMDLIAARLEKLAAQEDMRTDLVQLKTKSYNLGLSIEAPSGVTITVSGPFDAAVKYLDMVIEGIEHDAACEVESEINDEDLDA